MAVNDLNNRAEAVRLLNGPCDDVAAFTDEEWWLHRRDNLAAAQVHALLAVADAITAASNAGVVKRWSEAAG